MKRKEFPLEVKDGSVVVKIYRVKNKARDSFTVSYFSDGKRQLKIVADGKTNVIPKTEEPAVAVAQTAAA